jgi:hypothetical protein
VRCQIGLRKYHLMQMTSHQGFTHVDVIPYDIVHPRTPRFLLPVVRSLGFVVEHAPVIRELCGTLYIWARKPGGQPRPLVNLAEHEALRGSVSVVAPCHNEEMNVEPLVDALVGMYAAPRGGVPADRLVGEASRRAPAGAGALSSGAPGDP